jgi:hypothetical protein
MLNLGTSPWGLAAVCAVSLFWPADGNAQSVSGQARAVQATTSAGTTTLTDTGTLGGATDAREASAIDASIPSVLSGRALHATTIGWSDQASSEASVTDLALTVGGNTITADLAQARVIAARRNSLGVNVAGLIVNGNAIAVTGGANQTIPLSGGVLIINEQNGGTVNALHVIINGEADVVIASARASAQ